MDREEKQRATEDFLIKHGWDADSAMKKAIAAIDSGEPLLEEFCFNTLAEFFLASIHDSSWVKNRAEDADSEEGDDIIKRLLDSGASPDDLALFARLMQRSYLSNLACILDGSGIWGTPDLPYEDFRIFAVTELTSPNDCKPEAQLTALHETLGFSDWETEMKLSREAADASQRKYDEERKRRGWTDDD